MSISDGSDNQCGMKTQLYGVAIGNALGKGYCNEDKAENGDEPDEDSRLESERQAADGASNAHDQFSSSTNHCSRLADTIPDKCQDNVNRDDVNLWNATKELYKRMWRMSAMPGECNKDRDRNCLCKRCRLREYRKAKIYFNSLWSIEWRSLWSELQDHVMSVFDFALKATVAGNTVQYQCDPCKLQKLRQDIDDICKKDSQQLLLMLIVYVEEFMTTLKCRIAVNTPDFNKKHVAVDEQAWEQIAEVFLTQILNDYDAFSETAKQVSDLLKPVEEKHLLKANFTWVYLNKVLYEYHIWMSGSAVKKFTEMFATKLTNSQKRHQYETLLERYVVFFGEMIALSRRWSDVDRLIDKCTYRICMDNKRLVKLLMDRRSSKTSKDECRANPTVVPESQENCEDFDNSEIDENTLCVSDTEMFLLNNDADVQSEVDIKSDEKRKEGKKDSSNLETRLDNALKLEKNGLSNLSDYIPQKVQPCQCPFEYGLESHEHGSDWLAKSTASDVLRVHYRIGFDKPCPGFATRETFKYLLNSNVESRTPTTRNATVPATTLNHNHNHTPRTVSTHTSSHESSTDPPKRSGSNHRHHTHNNHASHTCHKQAKVEHIKRVLCNDLSSGDGDCSDSGSSQGDSCSTSSSTPRDSSRHCDCCYCEVFGPGLLSVAPVSRNYNEMRERLRQLLTKKKAKKCKAPCSSPPKSPAESSISSSTSTDHKATPPLRNTSSRSNTPIQAVPSTQAEPQRDQRDLEALLEFIEGNQGTKKDNKKTEKKARQKQRKLDEILRKAKEEEDKQKLIELQKKTPEVTITVVDPLKPMSHKLPHRNLPEVSILPAVASPAPMLASQKQTNTSKKKDNKQAQHPKKASQKQEKVVEKLGISNTGKNKNSPAAASPVNMNMYDFVLRDASMEKTKSNAKSNNSKNVKIVNSKSEKVQPVPPPAPANRVEELKLTKKERKKLRREMKKLEASKENQPEQKAPTVTDNKPQIVTIKRVMESNTAEPTVTITLKGQTPAEDKVLFTLVNGQTKDPGSGKAETDRSQTSGGKKKKGKGNGGNTQNNSTPSQQPAGKVQQKQNQVTKQQTSQKSNDTKSGKQQPVNEKSKKKKAEEKRSAQETQQSINETPAIKSKKDKKKADVEQVANKTNAKTKNPQQSGKNQNKSGTNQAAQKSQQNQNTASDTGKKKTKGNQQQEQSTQTSKNKKKTEPVVNKQTPKNDNQKNRVKNNQPVVKQPKASEETLKGSSDLHSTLLSSQLKDFGPSTKINIENLKLPPGITITKVDAPAKSLPIKSVPMPKPVTATKQTTIIAAPMSGVQSSYPGPQTGGNVIVVDTGKLKQDLLPKNLDKKEPQVESGAAKSSKKKKKKKKGQNSATSAANLTNGPSRNGSDAGKENGEEGAKIVHTPGSNMVTIRNPAFGPAPKIDTTPQAAIIKVSDNGMVTIRSPALQHAINAGMTPPSQPDFIVKGDTSLRNNANSVIAGNRTTMSTPSATSHKNSNGIISPSLAEFRSRLATSDCNSLPGLANIQISKVTNGQPIPDRGINLRGTSVTLTKVRSPDVSILNAKVNSSVEDPQAKTALAEAINASMNVSGNSKGKKKKKRGNGTKITGDDWNLVESVFTPKDIDLEDGEMDDAERELEAFKRFCLQSVPPPRKEKVNLNIKDIVLKKKSSSAAGTGAAIAAN